MSSMKTTPAQLVESITRSAGLPACRISERRYSYLRGLLDESREAGDVDAGTYERLCNRLSTIVTVHDPLFWAHEEGRLF